MKDLQTYPLKEIEGEFNKEMWRDKTGVRMKYKGISDANRAVFEIYPISSLGIVISDFDITAELDYKIKEMFKQYELEVDVCGYDSTDEDIKITLYVKPS
jgi:HSP20 family molecular chaperone IbpA